MRTSLGAFGAVVEKLRRPVFGRLFSSTKKENGHLTKNDMIARRF
jgi:hypothetical protein